MSIDQPGSIDPRVRINPNAPIDPVPKTDPGAAPVEGSRFQELLEALERLRVHGGQDAGSEAVRDLGRAVGAADDLHRNAMDLKQRLEAAFKRALGDA